MARPKVAAGYPSLRKLLESLFPDGKTAPKLAGPDLYAQHSYQYTLDQALAGEDQVIPTPLHVLGRISPIFPPFFPVFCAFSPSRRGGSNEPQAGAQGQETVARAPKHRFGGLANSGCSERMAV